MAKAPCMTCKTRTKAPNSHRCTECLLRTLPVATRVARAQERMLMVPPSFRRARVPAEEWPIGRRWCSGCQTFVLMKDVPKNGSKCKTCTSTVAWAGRVASTYTIHGRPFTADDYDQLLRDQGGRCWLCHREVKSKRLAIDHDHRTGEVRGLLCPDNERGCNHAVMGNIDANNDPLAMAERIVAYIKSPPAQRLLK